MSSKEINKLKSKGIYTINQFSYSFNPKIVNRKGFKDKPKHLHSLKALAIRDNKVYIIDGFSIPKSNVSIYFDIEGIPDRGLYYLIELVICKKTLFAMNIFGLTLMLMKKIFG